MIDKIIFELLLKDGNETHFIKNANVHFDFQELIKELIKIKYDIRYCKNKDCCCHPEHRIKELMKNKKLLEFLRNYCYKDISKDVLELVTNYEPKIAKGIMAKIAMKVIIAAFLPSSLANVILPSSASASTSITEWT